MSLRRSIRLAIVSIVVLALHLLAVRLAAENEIASVLLGAGNAMPPIGAALGAVVLVVLRFGAIVVAPGVLLASFAGVVAHFLVGPRRQGDEEGSGTISGAGISVAVGAGTNIGVRGTK